MAYPVEIKDLTVVFPSGQGSVTALNRLSLTVEQGRVFGFLGPNGAGKTTTMHVLLGFVNPASGMARMFGADVQQSIARERIGYLPEHPDTYRFLNGRELLRFTGRLFRMRGQALESRIDEVLKEVDLADAAERRVGTYSRGMLQRIGLAQALINNPDLVILDEPTSGLDPIGRMAMRQIVLRLRDQGKTVFFSSHELSEVELVCDYIAIVARGSIVAEGIPSKLVGPGESLEKYFLRIVSR
jgi:ABC-2 type transport system ATP-binding protein